MARLSFFPPKLEKTERKATMNLHCSPFVFSVREVGSALCAATSQNLSAVSRLHSLAEAMLLLALELFGLVSSQHSKPLLSGITFQRKIIP